MSNRHYHDKQTLAARESWRINHSANFFHILSAAGDLSIGFNRQKPTPLASGFERSPVGGFTLVEIVNDMDVAQEIEIICTDDKIRDGRMVVSGSINANITGGNLNIDNLPQHYSDGLTDVERKGVHSVGNNIACYSGAGGVVTVVPPASNVNGIIIRSSSIYDGNLQWGGLRVGLSAPVSIFDPAAGAHIALSYGTETGLMPIKIAAGDGLYAVASNSVYGSVSWDDL